MKWTEQQKKAIETRGRSIIVSAAAGSGKTAVLVERLLQILSDASPDNRVEADRIIVVTFTRDAAAQMKQRLSRKISEKLDEMSHQGKNRSEEYDWLIQQRSALGNAKISTIHSFCFDFIREHADACGVSAQFSIAEPAREYIFKKRALQSVLENWSKERKEEIAVLFNYFCNKHDAELEKIILLLADYLNSLAFPEYWIKQAKVFCQEGNPAFIEEIRQYSVQEIQDCIHFAEQSRQFAVDAYNDAENRKYEIILNTDIQQMQAHQQYIRNADNETLAADSLRYWIKKFKSLPGGKKNEDYYHEEEKKIFEQTREIYKSKYTKLVENILKPLQFWKEDEQIQKQVIPLLLELTELYQKALFAEKKKQNVLSFDDAEHLVLSLLGHIDENGKIQRSALAESISAQYHLIMVDEYQDSNDKQDCLFKLLSQNCGISPDDGTLHYGKNAFLVGDVKQSIYRFRQANPENFRKAIQDSTILDDCQEQEMGRIYLNQNFRSASGILKFINQMFRTVMTEKCGELVYDIHEQLNFGADNYQYLSEEYQGVQVLLPKSDAEIAVDDLQAECVVDTIADMLEKKVPVMLPDGTVRPCEYRDFCVLVRSLRNISGVLGKALQKRGIPFSCEEEDGFLTLPEICLIWNLLKILDNPMTDMAMAGVLMSPVYGFTPEDLAMLKISGTGERVYLQLQSLTGQDTALSRKCSMFLEQFRQMRSLADTMPLEQFIDEIYEITDMLSLQSLYEHADERREHLEIFMQYARSYREHADLTAQSSLTGFLHYLNYLKENDKENTKKFSVPLINAKANYLSIKTIHKSKGLEYPFVFLIHMERLFSKKPAPPSLLPAQNGMLGLQMIDRKRCLKIKSAIYQYVQYEQRKKDKSEEMRLLYVAMTRAKQKLFLVTSEMQANTKSKTNICNMSSFLENCPSVVPDFAAEAGSMQDWLLAYLLSSPEADYLKKAMNEGISCCSSMAVYHVWSPEHTAAEPEQKIITSVEPDEKLILKMQNQLNYQYTSLLTELPAKRSVTSLLEQEDEFAEQSDMPDFMLEDEEGRICKLKGNARGTAIHKIMQFMDFHTAAQDIQTELKRMQKAEILETIEAESIQPEKIKAFFDSALYQRIAVSDSVLKEKQLFVQIGSLHLPESSVLLQNYRDTDGILIGTVDLLFREPDGWVIVDYKTNNVHHEQQLLDKYSLQLGLYQKAMELILDKPVKQAYIYSFALNRAIEVNLSSVEYT